MDLLFVDQGYLVYLFLFQNYIFVARDDIELDELESLLLARIFFFRNLEKSFPSKRQYVSFLRVKQFYLRIIYRYNI